jgi:hypothetical protein
MGSAGKKSFERSPSASARASPLRTQASTLDPLLSLQQTVGNQAVLWLLGNAQPKLRSAAPPHRSGLSLQKKCASCSGHAPCGECADEEQANESSTAAQAISNAGLQFQKTRGEDDPVTVENIPATPDPTKKPPPVKPAKPPDKPAKPQDKPVQPPAGSPPRMGEILENLGRAWCDPDQGKMVTEIETEKVPACMLDCINKHEQAHVKFGQAECTKVSAVYQKVQKLIPEVERLDREAGQDPSKTDPGKTAAAKKKLKEAMQKLREAIEKLRTAREAYEKWHDQKCKENEKQAYQAGIDACKEAKFEKACADSKETERYKRMMKEWEDFKKNPPSCK